MQGKSLQQIHQDNYLRAVERQRNESMTREAQKDAIVALLQDQAEAMRKVLEQKESDIEDLKKTIETLQQGSVRDGETTEAA